MGRVGEKIGKEGFEITFQCIYNLLSRRGYKTQKTCDLKNNNNKKKGCSKTLPVFLFQIKLTEQIIRTKTCDLFCS